jgi:hypothetical protein
MVEFQYFKSCPNASETLDILLELKNELDIDDSEIRIVQVPDLESAEKLRFQGSPTILVDGIDIYTGSRPEGFSYSCRIYSFDGEQTGIIPKEYIANKIAEYRQ